MKIKVNNFKRLINAVLITTFALCIFYFSSVTVTYSNPLPKHVIVKSGDTLWKIVNTYYPDDNLLKKTYEIAEYNKINDGSIYPGQNIILP